MPKSTGHPAWVWPVATGSEADAEKKKPMLKRNISMRPVNIKYIRCVCVYCVRKKIYSSTVLTPPPPAFPLALSSPYSCLFLLQKHTSPLIRKVHGIQLHVLWALVGFHAVLYSEPCTMHSNLLMLTDFSPVRDPLFLSSCSPVFNQAF
jgi:hypothetical protein